MGPESLDSDLVSVIISNRNSGQALIKSVQSVLTNDYKNIELIIVDNNSTDNCIELLESAIDDKRLVVVKNETDLGPAAGRNVGILKAMADYVAFLDSDTEVDRRWLAELMSVIKADPSIGACQSKLLIMNSRRLDYTGGYLSHFGMVVSRAPFGMCDEGQFDSIAEIFTTKSASMLARKKVLYEAGLFDEDYYMFLEETDLCWRIWLSGYRVLYVPSSIVQHGMWTYTRTYAKTAGETGAKYLHTFHRTRNYVLTCIKNLDTLNLIRILPLHICAWFAVAAWYVLHADNLNFLYVLKALTWSIRNARLISGKRRFVQRFVRKVPDSQLLPKMLVNEPLSYFYEKLTKGDRATHVLCK